MSKKNNAIWLDGMFNICCRQSQSIVSDFPVNNSVTPSSLYRIVYATESKTQKSAEVCHQELKTVEGMLNIMLTINFYIIITSFLVAWIRWTSFCNKSFHSLTLVIRVFVLGIGRVHNYSEITKSILKVSWWVKTVRWCSS